ncbi:MAG: inositol monophosphatase family protein, partial [bacterium]|nr:inositol monophosphatase family protein [bacterium]
MMQETEIAIEAAKRAGAYLRSVFGEPTEVRLKGDTSFVSDVDLEASRIIREHLENAFPSYGMLDEEMEDAKSYTFLEKPTWVVDPLDGTSNFLGHLPIFGIAIALVKNFDTVLGVIFDPIHDELFVAERGQGTTLDGERVWVSKRHGAKGGMLFAGRGYK